MKKSFYDQFGKSIDKEAKAYKSHAEKTVTEFKVCTHSKVKFINGELRCICGSSWSGPNLEMLREKLQGV